MRMRRNGSERGSIAFLPLAHRIIVKSEIDFTRRRLSSQQLLQDIWHTFVFKSRTQICGDPVYEYRSRMASITSAIDGRYHLPIYAQ